MMTTRTPRRHHSNLNHPGKVPWHPQSSFFILPEVVAIDLESRSARETKTIGKRTWRGLDGRDSQVNAPMVESKSRRDGSWELRVRLWSKVGCRW